MANAIILHRRRSEKIEPGSQTFTANGVFVAPYSAVYIFTLTGSIQKAGNGGDGANGYYYRPSGSIYADAWAGGGGGGGGGQLLSAASARNTVSLQKNQQVQITINNSMVSAGNFISCASGTPATNGISAISNNDAQGGSGGVAEETSNITGEGNLEEIYYGERGTNGYDGFNGASTGSSMSGGTGGVGGNNGGGQGGNGGSMMNQTGYPGASGFSGSPAVTGSITISWGGNT